MNTFDLFVLSLASFRMTRLIVYDQITLFIRKPFFIEEEMEEDGEVYYVPYPRGIRGWIGSLLNCYWCTGMWVTILLYIVYTCVLTETMHVILIFAIAGIAAIIESIVQKIIN